ncbi:MAG: tape measure protein [Bacteroidales bacterium]|nr:tape measure protein [Bacteroidales bacterium]
MATVDSLNFEVLIDDQDFNEKIKSMTETATGFNTTVSELLEIKAKVSQIQKESAKATRDEAQATREANRAIEEQARHEASMAESAERRNRATERSAIISERRASQAVINAEKEKKASIETERAEARKTRELERSSRAMERQSKLLHDLTGLLTSYFSITGASRLLNDLVDVTGEFEIQRTTLRAILNDVEGADNIFEQMRQLAVKSPFQFKDLASYAKQLSAFSIPMEELYDTTKMLADLSAGLGVDMGRIILAYGQIRSASFLRGQEVRQLTEAGVPILTELAKQFEEVEGRAVSVGEVFDRISARQVPFEMVAKVFKDITSEGGKFYEMQAVQAETLAGKISNLKDAYQNMLYEIGSANGDLLKAPIDRITSLMADYNKVFKELTVGMATFLSVRALTTFTSGINGSADSVSRLTLAMGKLKGALANHPYVALAAAVATLAVKLHSALTEQNAFNEAQEKAKSGYNVTLAEENAELDTFIVRIKTAKEGTDEYNSAKKALYARYGTYIAQLQDEGVAVDNLATLYASLKVKIADATRERFGFQASKSIDEAFADTLANLYGNARGRDDEIYTLRRLSKELRLSASETQAIWSYITGTATRETIESLEECVDLFDKIENGYVSLGSGSSGPIKAARFLQVLVDKATNAKNEYTDAKTAMEELFKTSPRSDANGPGAPLSQWQQSVQNVLDTVGAEFSNLFDQRNDNNLMDYIDKLKKERNEIVQRMAVEKGLNDKLYESDKARLDVIERINKEALLGRLDISYSKSSRESQEEDPYKATVKNKAEEVDAIKQVYDAYKQLTAAGLDASEAATVLSEVFGDQIELISAGNYEERLMEIADTMESFGDSGRKLALEIRKYLGRDGISKVLREVSQKNNAQSTRTWLESYLGTGELLEGKGVSFDISKIVKEYKDRLKALTDRTQRAREEYMAKVKASGSFYSEEEYAKGLEEIDLKQQTDAANYLSDALAKIREEAGKVVEEWAGLNGIDLSDFSHKTISQLRNMKSELEDYLAGDLIDSDIARKLVGDLAGATGQLSDEVAKVINEFLEKISEATAAKLAKEIIDIAKAVVSLSDAVSEYAKAAGILDLERTANAIGGIGGIIEDIAQGAKSGGWAGAIAAGISSFGKAALDAATAAVTLRSAIRETAIEAQSVRFSDDLSRGIDSLFGEDTLKKIRNATIGIESLREAISTDHANASGNLSWASGFLKMGKTVKSVGDAMHELGYDMLDSYGNLNADGLQAILDTYENLGEADRQWITEAINHSREYAEAMENLREVVSGIFGDLSRTVVDDMVEAFNATGDAANGLTHVFDDMSQSLLKSVMNTIVLEGVLNRYEEDLLGIFQEYGQTQDYRTMMDQVSGLMSLINRDLENSADVLNAVLSYAQSQGWNTGEASGSQNLASGIKSITEETGNLLASYINAIRSDVSSLRVIAATNSGYLQQILGLLPAVPTLDDYLNQISANTFDINQTTKDILSDLRSVMTSSAGEMAFRAAIQ